VLSGILRGFGATSIRTITPGVGIPAITKTCPICMNNINGVTLSFYLVNSRLCAPCLKGIPRSAKPSVATLSIRWSLWRSILNPLVDCPYANEIRDAGSCKH
jgi:hypothetical protein